MIYVKKCYKIMNYNVSTQFELLSFKIMINSIENNFIYGYKPPNVLNADFIDHLDSLVKN